MCVPRVSRVCRGNEVAFAGAVDKRPILSGLESMVVVAETVEKVEEGVVGSGPIFPVIRLESRRDAASFDGACRIEEIEGGLLMATRLSSVVVHADDLFVVGQHGGDEGVLVGGERLDG